MLKVQEIRELIKLLDGSSLSELVYEENDCKIELRKPNGSIAEGSVTPVSAGLQAQETKTEQAVQQIAPVSAKEEASPPIANADHSDLHKIVSPMVGTFYASPSPEDPSYVNVGEKVKADDVVCIVEAMKLFNEIEAEVSGEVVEILVENGQLVEYGQPLFLVKPE